MPIEALEKKLLQMNNPPITIVPSSKKNEKGDNDIPIPSEDEKMLGDYYNNNNNNNNNNVDNGSEEMILKPEHKPKRNYVLWTQILGAMTVAFVHIGIGTNSALSGVVLPQLTDKNSSEIYFDQNEAALFSSIINAGGMVGSLSSGPMFLLLGQRRILLLLLPMTCISWLALGLSPNVASAITARFAIGAFCGIMTDCCTSYIVEYAHADVRGKLGAAIDISRQFGYLLVYTIGSTGLSWRYVSYICGGIATVIPFSGLLFFPNSPRWLATRGRLEESRKALQFFRGKKYDVDHEMAEIKFQLSQVKNSGSIVGQLKQMLVKSVALRVLLVAFIMLTIPFNGNLIVVGYSVVIFQSANTGLDSYMCTIVMGVVRVLGALSFVLLGERMRRRTLFFTCFIVSALSLVVLGIYFYLTYLEYNMGCYSWIPLASLIVFMFSTALVGPVLSMLRSELLPNSVRAIGVGISIVMMFVGSFIVTQTFPTLINILGNHGAYWFYASCGLLVVIIAALTLPETKGKTLEEINEKIVRKISQQNEANEQKEQAKQAQMYMKLNQCDIAS